MIYESSHIGSLLVNHIIGLEHLLPLYIKPIEKLIKQNGWEILGFPVYLGLKLSQIMLPQFNRGGCRWEGQNFKIRLKGFTDKIYHFKLIMSLIVHRDNGVPWTNFEEQMVQRPFTHNRDNNNIL